MPRVGAQKAEPVAVSDAPATVHRKPSKLAAVVADRIVGDITDRGWPTGQVIGSEADLVERYGVSRAVFREALRLVEHLGVARMRRGPGGGLVVLEASVDSVTDAVAVYLLHRRVDIDDVFHARLALEETVAELAPARIEESGIHDLRELVEREGDGGQTDRREFHRRLAAAASNPALEFLVDLLTQVTGLYVAEAADLAPEHLRESIRAHGAIADAVIAGDIGLARQRMTRHLHSEATFLDSAERGGDVRNLRDNLGRRGKRAEQLAGQIIRDIVEAGWPVDDLFGSEAELVDRYGVSRAVFREAIRVLEHHQVARMRRGPGGGLFVATPGAEAVIDAVALHVERLGIQPRHLFEARAAIEMAALDLAIQHLDEKGEDRLRSALAAEEEASRTEFVVVGHELHGVLAGMSGNNVLELLTLVLVRVTRLHTTVAPGAPDPVPTEEVTKVHQRIVEAVLDGDVELAQHRMRRHLDALIDWSR